MNEKILRVSVWPASVRFLHLLMGSTMLVLLFSGTLMQSGMILNARLFEHLLEVWHLPAGHVFALALLLRLMLLVLAKGVAGFKALTQWDMQGIVGTAVFYASFARMNLPGYFAHNPLWKIIYLLFFVLSSVAVFSGFLLESNWLQSVVRSDGHSALHWHRLLLAPLGVIVLLHILTVVLHDWKSPGGEVSAMINGHKYFTVEQSADMTQQVPSAVVSLDSLTKKQKP